MYPHRINLRGPWEAEALAATMVDAAGKVVTVDAPLPPPGPMMLPSRWAAAGWPDFWGRARFRRRFQWVHPLGGHERLWLGCLGCDGRAELVLNGTPLGTHDEPFTPFCFDVTAFVRGRNELLIDLDAPADPHRQRLPRGCRGAGGGLWGTVFLEVRREVSIDDWLVMPTWLDGRAWLECSGRLQGEVSQPLNLSLRVATHELAFEPLARPGPFHVLAPLPAELPRWQPSGQGLPHLHVLQADLLDEHASLDHRELTFGFTEKDWPDRETVVVNGQRRLRPTAYHLTEPVQEAATLDAADREGRLLIGVLPFPDPARLAVALRTEALHVAEQVRRLTGHHPCLARWEFAP